MWKSLMCLIIFLLVSSCTSKPGPVKAKAAKDPKVAAVEEKIAKTTPEGKDMVEKVKGMKPDFNESPSAKTLGEIVDDYAKNKGTYNIEVIGWEGSQKASTGNWKIALHYQDWEKNLLYAEWEYNPKTNKLYPFEKVNAPQFWSGVAADGTTPPAKGKK